MPGPWIPLFRDCCNSGISLSGLLHNLFILYAHNITSSWATYFTSPATSNDPNINNQIHFRIAAAVNKQKNQIFSKLPNSPSIIRGCCTVNPYRKGEPKGGFRTRDNTVCYPGEMHHQLHPSYCSIGCLDKHCFSFSSASPHRHLAEQEHHLPATFQSDHRSEAFGRHYTSFLGSYDMGFFLLRFLKFRLSFDIWLNEFLEAWSLDLVLTMMLFRWLIYLK